MSNRTIKLRPRDLCDDCLNNAVDLRQKEYARNLLRRIFEPTWREQVDDFYVNYILRRWVIWFGDYTDDFTLEQRIAQRLPWNKGEFDYNMKVSKELKHENYK